MANIVLYNFHGDVDAVNVCAHIFAMEQTLNGERSDAGVMYGDGGVRALT